jgi:hypothetical protein
MCCWSARRARAKPTHHNTPNVLTFLPRGTIDIVDPTHPLYGLRLPLLGVTTKQYVGKACVVWIQPGIERIIPFAATNLADSLPPPPSCLLSPQALQRLLRVVASIAELRPEDADERESHAATLAAAPGQSATAAATRAHPAAAAEARAGVADALGRRAGADQEDVVEGDGGRHQ